MKHIYKALPALMLVISVLCPLEANAQESDTLTVEWRNEDQTVRFNGLFETIAADTNENGERIPNRVYKLRQGGYYYVEERIENNGWHLHIVGEEGDPTDPTKFPPMIQLITREDGTRTDKIFQTAGDFTLKNVILNGRVTNGDLPYEIVRFDGNDATITIDNVIWERAQWGIFANYGQNVDIYLTNSMLRNLVSESQPWGGRGFSVWSNIDTMIVENNTFVNIGGFAAQLEGGTQNFFVFNHNTIVGNGRQVVLGAQMQNAYITNNLVLNGFWQGEDLVTGEVSAERLASDDEQYAGMFAIDNLPADVGLDVSRRVAIANNNFYMEGDFDSWLAAEDSIRKQPLVNVFTQNLFDAVPGMVINGNLFDEQDPGFTTYPDNNADRIQFITDIRGGASEVTLHYWDPGRGDDNFSVMWPLPGDYTYSNTTLQSAAIGGYPLGDLNWYPAQKATWEANKDAQYAAIETLMGGIIETTYLTNIGTDQAALGGNSEVVAAPDRQIARIEASGNIVWEGVEMTAGNFDVAVSHRTWYADNNPARQTDLVVNDGASNAIQIGVEQDGTTWSVITVPDVAFTDGANKVALNRSWGYMEYEYVQIKEAGTENVVTTLYPAEGELVDGGSYLCPSGGVCASGDDLIDTKDGGTATFTYEAEGNGTLIARLSYFLPDGAADVTVTLNDVQVGSATLESSGDSVYTEFDFSDLAFVQGTNEVVINATSGGVWIDGLDLFLVGEFMQVSNEEETSLASQFELSQNYPNPFNPSTNINFALPVASDVQLTIFNLLGQKVATLVDEPRMAGNYTVRFDASHLASGIYFYTLKAGEINLQRKMTLIK